MSAPQDGLGKRLRHVKYLAAGAVAMVFVTLFVMPLITRERHYRLRVSAGSERGHRHDLAVALAEEVGHHKITVEIVPTAGSVESLRLLAEGELDVAFVQGGLRPPPADLRQLTILHPEPLHLVARPKLAEAGLASLLGKRINLSTKGSGSRQLSEQVLQFYGVGPGDYIDESHSYRELQQMPAEQLPDAMFFVSSMPSDIAEFFVRKRNYRLIAIPFGRALSMRDTSLTPVEIPYAAYRAYPAEPREPIATIAPRLNLVARADVPAEAVERLLTAMYDGDFRRRAEIGELSSAEIEPFRELPLHEGTIAFLRRHEPIVTNEFIDNAESARSFVFSALVAAFLLWQWYRRKQAVRFEEYFDEVSALEARAFAALRGGTFTERMRNDLLDELTRLKERAIESYSSGRVHGQEHLTGFISHVADARQTVRTLRVEEAELRRQESEVGS
ncbi:TAXI family TRAP transporter solute-binding subunit [Stratiformator vulcanicus]|uniref:LysR substrate binding domain protein n=1 Tax=Stratiformator vulcanicus TaxID=2527980 RepID=A0A517QVP6_9PLAN|nr:TAXI family TRAP transporter solute-binding subunit [Stratiformator vulcanicus]QDT35680.1 LysR substrate binding domain protein [Stratiformator vulcanicus]